MPKPFNDLPCIWKKAKMLTWPCLAGSLSCWHAPCTSLLPVAGPQPEPHPRAFKHTVYSLAPSATVLAQTVPPYPEGVAMLLLSQKTVGPPSLKVPDITFIDYFIFLLGTYQGLQWHLCDYLVNVSLSYWIINSCGSVLFTMCFQCLAQSPAHLWLYKDKGYFCKKKD